MRIPKIEKYSDDVSESFIYLEKHKLERPRLFLVNEKERIKFIKHIEKTVRMSYEYKEYINYLKEEYNMTFCSVYENINRDNIPKVRIEIHHEPFTLYDIVNIVLCRFINTEREINEYDLTDEVLKLHFSGIVSLIPVSVTVHQLIHAGKVFIPLSCLSDGYKLFYEEYKTEISQCDLENIYLKKLEFSEKFKFTDNNILYKKYIYLNNENYDNMVQEVE